MLDSIHLSTRQQMRAQFFMLGQERIANSGKRPFVVDAMVKLRRPVEVVLAKGEQNRLGSRFRHSIILLHSPPCEAKRILVPVDVLVEEI